jgi:hypothetical protein
MYNCEDRIDTFSESSYDCKRGVLLFEFSLGRKDVQRHLDGVELALTMMYGLAVQWI